MGNPNFGQGSVFLFDATTGKELRRLDHPHGIMSVAFSRDGAYLAGGSGAVTEDGHSYGEVLQWDLGTGRMISSSRAHQALVTSVALSTDGQLLASGSLDGTVRVCEAQTGRLVRSLTGAWREDDTMSHLTFSADNRYLAASDNHFDVEAGGKGRVLVWDTRTWRVAHALIEPDLVVTALDFSPDGKTLAGAVAFPTDLDSTQGVVRLWDLRTGKRLRTLKVRPKSKNNPGEDGLRVVLFSPDGRTLATGSGRSVASVELFPNGRTGPPVSRGPGLIRLWDAKNGRLLRTVKAHEYAVTSLAYSRDGRMLISSSYDKRIRQWALRPAR